MFKRMSALFITLMFMVSLLPQTVFGLAYDPGKGYEDLGIRFWEDKEPEVGFYINAASRYILQTVEEPEMGSTFGEWSVMDLLRGMYTGADYMNYIPDNYFEDYIERIETYVDAKNGNLDRAKSTEWSRLILSLTALGYDITDVAGYDFIERLSASHRFSYRQGINGPIWEIIAMNTGRYNFYPDDTNNDVNTFGKMIEFILDREITQVDDTVGGWSLFGKIPDPDITAMAVQALAPYYNDRVLYEQSGATTSYEEFLQVVERAIFVFSEIQNENGAYEAFGNVNSESTVQVIVALTALNIDPKINDLKLNHIGKTVSFIKEGRMQDGVWTNNMVDALLTFWAPGSGVCEEGVCPEVSGFKHVTTGNDGGGGSGFGVNAMGTDQSLYGLIAYDRFIKGENALYDMTDMNNGQYKEMMAAEKRVTYDVDREVEMEKHSPFALVTIPQGKDERGKEFLHWNSKEDGTGTVYEPGERLSMPAHDITLYAQYENLLYNIAYEFNGGTFNGENLVKAYTVEDEVVLPTAEQLRYEGYNFLGWYEHSDYSGDPISVIEAGSFGHKTVYAKWEESKEDLLAAEAVDAKIDALPLVADVTLDDQAQVAEAKQAYDQLSDEAKSLVKNLSKLQALEEKLEQLTEDARQQVLAKEVEAQINALPTVEALTIDDKAQVLVAREAYQLLSLEAQQYVGNLLTLEILESKLVDLEAGIESERLAEEVINLIEGLPTAEELTLAYKEQVKEARIAYEKLTAEAKALVSNVEKLEGLEVIILQLEEEAKAQAMAKEVEQQIETLPSIEWATLENRYQIAEARAAYEKLPLEIQALVMNISKLESLEEVLRELQVEQVQLAANVEAQINALPSKEEVGKKDTAKIREARIAYENLATETKLLVGNILQLEELEEVLAQILAEENQVIAKQVEELIASLPELNALTLENSVQIEEARTAFNELSLEQQNFVANLEQLVNAESKINALLKEINDVEQFISQLPTVDELTVADEQLIKEARNAYEALTEEQQLLVTNIGKLKEAEEKLAQLKANIEQPEKEPVDEIVPPGNSTEEKDPVDEIVPPGNSTEEKDPVDEENASTDTPEAEKGVSNGQGQLEDVKKDKLPKTATNLYNLLMFGMVSLFLGVVLYITNRRRAA